MTEEMPPITHRPSNTILTVLLLLACAAAAIDIWDGQWLKTVVSVMIAFGIIALMFARRYNSSRWRVAMLMAFIVAALAMFARLAIWQGWV